MEKLPMEKIKLYSLDNFLASVKSSPKYSKVSRVTLAGFKSVMESQDKKFVFDEHEYVDALEDYIK